FGRKKKQSRTDPLAPAVPQIFANLGDRLYARDGILPELALQRRKILVQQVEDFLPVNERRCAQCGFRLLDSHHGDTESQRKNSTTFKVQFEPRAQIPCILRVSVPPW